MAEATGGTTVVGTLPLNPAHETIGAFSSPLITDLLARSTGRPSVIGVNLIGRRAPGKERDETLHRLTSRMAGLGVTPDLVWCDDHPSVADLAREAVSELYRRELVTPEVEPVYLCGCGAFEVPERAMPDRVGTRHVMATSEQGAVTCRVCGETPEPRQTPGLHLRFDRGRRVRVTARPGYAAAEVRQMVADSTDLPWRITRNRHTGVPVELAGATYHLDVDFVWSLMPTALARRRLVLGTVVVSNLNVYQAVRTLHVNQLLGESDPPRPELVVHPILRDGSGDRMSGPAYHIDDLRAQYEPRPLRLWLSLGLSWQHKRTRLPTRELYWCLRAVRTATALPAGPGTPDAVPDLLRALDADALRAAMTAARKGKPVPARQADVLRTVLGAEPDPVPPAPGPPAAAPTGTDGLDLLPAAQRRTDEVRDALLAARPDAGQVRDVVARTWQALGDLLSVIGVRSDAPADVLTEASAQFPDVLDEPARRTMRYWLDGPDAATLAALPEPDRDRLLGDCAEVYEAAYEKLLALLDKRYGLRVRVDGTRDPSRASTVEG